MLSPRFAFGLVAALLLSRAAAACAEPYLPLIGTWHASTPVQGMTPISIDLLLAPDGRFAERTKYNGGKSTAFGTYKLVKNHDIRLTFLTWTPKSVCTSIRCEVVVKPPDATYEIQYLSATTMTVQEKKFGNVIIFKRIR